MAKVRTARFVDQLKDALVEGLGNVGIDADVRMEPVPTTRLYRVFVVASNFKPLKHTERQNLVWRMAERVLSPENQLRVSMIVTLTPEEAGEQRAARVSRRSAP